MLGRLSELPLLRPAAVLVDRGPSPCPDRMIDLMTRLAGPLVRRRARVLPDNTAAINVTAKMTLSFMMIYLLVSFSASNWSLDTEQFVSTICLASLFACAHLSRPQLLFTHPQFFLITPN